MCDTPEKLKSGQVVPCGKCADCIGMRRDDWFKRIYFEAYKSLYTLFVTLTYNDEHLPLAEIPVLNYPDIQKYFKRLRKIGLQFKYFGVGEYGEHYARPHYHCLFFFQKEFDFNHLETKWMNGNVHVMNANEAMIKYTLKDMLKETDIFDGVSRSLKPHIYCSKGIGISYVEQFEQWHALRPLERNFMVFQGKSKRLPRYFRNKIFTQDERILQGIDIQNSRCNLDSLPKNVSRKEIQELHHQAKIYSQVVESKRKRQISINHFNKKL